MTHNEHQNALEATHHISGAEPGGMEPTDHIHIFVFNAPLLAHL